MTFSAEDDDAFWLLFVGIVVDPDVQCALALAMTSMWHHQFHHFDSALFFATVSVPSFEHALAPNDTLHKSHIDTV